MPEWAGTLPNWITALSASGGFGLWLRYLSTRRQQDGARLADLEKENRQLRLDFDEYREKCVRETDGLRELIEGLRAQMLQLQFRGIAGAIDVPPASRATFDDLLRKLDER